MGNLLPATAVCRQEVPGLGKYGSRLTITTLVWRERATVIVTMGSSSGVARCWFPTLEACELYFVIPPDARPRLQAGLDKARQLARQLAQ